MTPSNANEDAFTTPPLVKSRAQTLSAAPVGARLRTLLTFSLAVAVVLAVHLFVSKKEPAPETRSYTIFLCAVLAIALLTAPAQLLWSGLRLLPLPYFPSPAKVLQSLISDRMLLFDSTWHSLILLISGYALGVVAGLISGICVGWSSPIRYWGMPVLKVVGPIPATAWIPLAMVISPSAVVSAAALIALAVWFPVTMLTASGISNTRASYLDVARTLGAGRGYLIFRVAIPAALPSIFIGLFRGLGDAKTELAAARAEGARHVEIGRARIRNAGGGQ